VAHGGRFFRDRGKRSIIGPSSIETRAWDTSGVRGVHLFADPLRGGFRGIFRSSIDHHGSGTELLRATFEHGHAERYGPV